MSATGKAKAGIKWLLLIVGGVSVGSFVILLIMGLLYWSGVI